jgi:hypothetical protein
MILLLVGKEAVPYPEFVFGREGGLEHSFSIL